MATFSRPAASFWIAVLGVLATLVAVGTRTPAVATPAHQLASQS